MLRLGIPLALACVCVLGSLAHADEFATSPARPGYEASAQVLGWPARTRLQERGFKLEGTYSLEMFAAPQLDNRVVVGGLFMVELDMDLDALAANGLGVLRVSALGVHGEGLTVELMDVHGTSGNTAPQDVRLFEAWYEQPISAITLRAGLLSADQEFVLADQSGTLLGATFGITSQFSANLLGPVYPVAAPGASGRFELDDLTLRLGVFDGTQTNTHGLPTTLGPDHLVIGELGIGPIKVGAWHHSERGEAVYAIADAQLDDQLGAFTRVGLSPETPVDTYIDAGVRIGSMPLRPDDFVSLGVAFARTERGAETMLEATYEAQVRWLTIQPGMQLMMLRERTVGVVATRMTVVF